ncbi:hypothetical protein HY572_01950 [Candidatus Micrarchaeota archaeon]|nr:hypothetical protein [Candidatus Micrarchaeota archaeon]
MDKSTYFKSCHRFVCGRQTLKNPAQDPQAFSYSAKARRFNDFIETVRNTRGVEDTESLIVLKKT